MDLPTKWINTALQNLTGPITKKCGAGLATIYDQILERRYLYKGPIRLELERIIAEQHYNAEEDGARKSLAKLLSSSGDEQQRRLSLAATSIVPADRLSVPPFAILGKIYRESEFDETEPMIWELWTQLLARACDQARVGEAHPSYPWIISQLSSDEARLSKIFAGEARPYLTVNNLDAKEHLRDTINKRLLNELFISDNKQVMRNVDHLEALGLIYYMNEDYEVGEEDVFYILPPDWIKGHIAFTAYGKDFVRAVGQAKS